MKWRLRSNADAYFRFVNGCYHRWYLTIIPRVRIGSESTAMRPKAEWAIDSEAKRARGIIVLVKSNYLVKNIETKQL